MAEEKKEAPKSTCLEDLARYESAAIASFHLDSDPQLSSYAIDNFYHKQKKEMFDDPIWLRGYQKAQEDIKYGFSEGEKGLLSADIHQAINVYDSKYESAFVQGKLSELGTYLTEGFSVSDEVKAALDKYKDLSLKEVGEKLKDKGTPDAEKKDLGNIAKTVGILKERRLREKGVKLYNSMVTESLGQMYPKSEEKTK